MKNRFRLLVITISLLFSFTAPLFAEDTTPLPYDSKEFPQGLKDLRRFEIITLGAMPFVTLNTTLVYSGMQYVAHEFSEEYAPNIFAASTYTPEEQKKIILTSLGVCVGVGLTDYIIQLIKRSKKKRVNEVTYDNLFISPISEDPDAVPIPVEDRNSDEVEDINEASVEENSTGLENVELLNNDDVYEVED